tara:strand:- start:1610 stop:1861 length:252 start_codon:yes stop_codon:yes gene_type:complete
MTHKGHIKKIHSLQPTKSGKNFYTRIEIVLDNGKWCKTDVVKGFRNAKKWAQGIDKGVGTRVTGLKLITDDTVNADSQVRFYK